MDTIFFPVRDPDKVFKSEMNRQLARIVGDWSFPPGLNGWQKKWSLNQCNELKNQDLKHDGWAGFLPQKVDPENLKIFEKNLLLIQLKYFHSTTYLIKFMIMLRFLNLNIFLSLRKTFLKVWQEEKIFVH